VLTATGRQVLRYAQDIFARGEELESFLKSGAKEDTTLLRVGFLSTLSRNFIDRLIAPLLADPKVQLLTEAAPLENLLAGLSKHQLDVALTNADVRGSDEQLWQSRLLAQQPIAIIGPPIPGRKPRFPSGFREQSWVLPSRDSEIRKAFDAYCSRHNFVPKIVAEANDMPMLRLLARDSGALTVLPLIVVGDELERGVLQEYRRLPEMSENFYAITIRRTQRSPVVERLLSQSIGALPGQ
jgi:LysR family transcriptional activator of nhaA